MNQGMRGKGVIRTPDQRLRVFVSSTVGEAGELAAERRAVVRAISALRLTPVMFELGARPYPPRELYRAYLAQRDIFVGLYWQRYGRVRPGMELSSLEEELQQSEGCRACCTSRRRRPTASPAWPRCRPGRSPSCSTTSRAPRGCSSAWASWPGIFAAGARG
ncbi:MAG TPA: DUF4062 domain-containing protein [Actinomycetota bacterium]|nr:DUF4062 domain-containing protein [Actinomycetota bacterium]